MDARHDSGWSKRCDLSQPHSLGRPHNEARVGRIGKRCRRIRARHQQREQNDSAFGLSISVREACMPNMFFIVASSECGRRRVINQVRGNQWRNHHCRHANASCVKSKLL